MTNTNNGCACTPNQSIKCTVTNCAHHCQDQNYCGLNAITVGTHETNPTKGGVHRLARASRRNEPGPTGFGRPLRLPKPAAYILEERRDHMEHRWPARIAGTAAGLANGLFGGGGGMVFLPILSRWGGLSQRKLYATCVGVIFPVCLVSAAVYLFRGASSWRRCPIWRAAWWAAGSAASCTAESPSSGSNGCSPVFCSTRG